MAGGGIYSHFSCIAWQLFRRELCSKVEFVIHFYGKKVIMADRGFTLQDLFESLGVRVIMPNFLKGRDQFTKEETVMNQQIASERIY